MQTQLHAKGAHAYATECVEISKVGPKEQTIGKNADYQITVVNTGDKPIDRSDCYRYSSKLQHRLLLLMAQQSMATKLYGD